jgi:hypothetical protein
MKMYHVTVDPELFRSGASSRTSSMQGGGFYLWASKKAAMEYVDDPFLLKKRAETGKDPVILAFDVPEEHVEPDPSLSQNEVRDWADERSDVPPFPRGRGKVEWFNNLKASPMLWRDMCASVLPKVLARGGAVRYVGGDLLVPIDTTENLGESYEALLRTYVRSILG